MALHSSNHRNRRRNGGWAAGADRQARRGRRAAPERPEQSGGPRQSRGCGTPRRAYRAATPTRQADAGGQRRRAQKGAATSAIRDASAARRLRWSPPNNAPLNPTDRRGGVRADLGVSRRRALRADRVCHADQQGIATPGGFNEVRQCALIRYRVQFSGARIGIHISRPYLEGSTAQDRLGG